MTSNAQRPARVGKTLSFREQNAILLSIQKYVDSQLNPKSTEQYKAKCLQGISTTINKQLEHASKRTPIEV